MKIPQKIRKFWSAGHSRSILIKRNIFGSFLVKGVSIIVNLALVPLTLDYLDETRYGIWLTLSSMIAWIGFFDIGLGNGLRNRLAEAWARGDEQMAKVYVSTTYFTMGAIFLGLYGIYWLAQPFLNWTKILNAPMVDEHELALLATIVFTFFVVRFVVQLIGKILLAAQMAALNNALMPLSNLLALGVIFVLTKTTQGTLVYVGMALAGMPVIFMTIVSIVLFRTRFKAYAPSWKSVDLKYFKDIGNLGVQFFFIQISALLIMTTGNIVLTQVLGPESVTPFNIAYKYFNIMIMLNSIIIMPFWSAFTDAYARGDLAWIRRMNRKLNFFWIAQMAGIVIMLLVANKFYHFWVGDRVQVPFALSASLAVYAAILTFNTKYVSFINGSGKIWLQFVVSIFTGLANIPLSVYLAKYTPLGVAGVPASMCITLVPALFLWPLQYRKLINGTARGVWNK